MGRLIGHDFSTVRVFDDARADEAVRRVDALAFTVGDRIVLGAEARDPRLRQPILAHELSHVLQSRLGGASSGDTTGVSVPDDQAEREASAVARAVGAGTPTLVRTSVPVGTVSRLTREEGRALSSQSRLLVEDDATPGPAQIPRQRFVDELEAALCRTVETGFAGTEHEGRGCPFLADAMRFYRGRPTAEVEASIHRYAPETRAASSYREYIAAIERRVARSVDVFVETGRIEGVPDEIAPSLAGAAAMGSIAGILQRAIGGIGSAISSVASGVAGLFRWSRAGAVASPVEPAEARARLGAGRPLDAGARARMERALGHDFSRVRIHTDEGAVRTADQVAARAFTIGSDVAFASGEYRPNTLVGDALLAHELSHTVQQDDDLGDAGEVAESRADEGAAAAVLSLWGPGRRSAMRRKAPAARARGLRLQRCGPGPQRRPPAAARPQRPQPPAAGPQAPAAPAQRPLAPIREAGPTVWFDRAVSEGPPTSGSGPTSRVAERATVRTSPGQVGPLEGITVHVRFGFPGTEVRGTTATGIRESSRLRQARTAILNGIANAMAQATAIPDGTPAEQDEARRRNARLKEVFRGFTQSSPLNIFIGGDPTEAELLGGSVGPVTDRVFVSWNDVNDPARLQAAIRIPSLMVTGGPMPGRGTVPAASQDVMNRTALHELVHVHLIRRNADSEATWRGIRSGLTLTGPAAATTRMEALIRKFLSGQEELFAYDQEAAAFGAASARSRYETFVRNARQFIRARGLTLTDQTTQLPVTERPGGQAVSWSITFSVPSGSATLTDEHARTLDFLLGTYPG